MYELITSKGCGGCADAKKILLKLKINFIETDIKKYDKEAKTRIVEVIRVSGFPGSYEELICTPILVSDEFAIPWKILTKEPRLLRALKRLTEEREAGSKTLRTPLIPPEKPMKEKRTGNLEINIDEHESFFIDAAMEDIAAHPESMDVIIDELLKGRGTDFVTGFFIGWRSAKHLNARKVLDRGLVMKEIVVKIMDDLSSEIDPLMNKG